MVKDWILMEFRRTVEFCDELEKRLNLLYDGFHVTYDEEKRTFDWRNQDIHFHFDDFSSARIVRSLESTNSLLSVLIKNLYKANDFMFFIHVIKTEIECFVAKPLNIIFTHLSNYNASHTSPNDVFSFCPIALFRSFQQKRQEIYGLTEIDHISAIFSHEYGHYLFNLEHDTILTTSKFSNQLKSMPYEEQVLLEKIKEHVIQQEKDAWSRGKFLALHLGVREEIYQIYMDSHLDLMHTMDKSKFRNKLYPYFKWNSVVQK